MQSPYFVDQMLRLRTILVSLLFFVRLLFEGGVYFFGKPTDINDGWIRYVRVAH